MVTGRSRALRVSVSAVRRRRRNGRGPLIDPAIVARLIEIRDGMDANEGEAPPKHAFERRVDDGLPSGSAFGTKGGPQVLGPPT